MKDDLALSLTMNVSLGNIPVIGVFEMIDYNKPTAMMPENAKKTSNLQEDGSSTDITLSLSPGKYWIAYGLMTSADADFQLYIYSTRQLTFF